MNIAVLHPQCRVRGGAIKMALLTARSLKQQGHNVIFYTFDHDSECFPELQDGLTIVTGKTTKRMNNEKGIMNNGGSEKLQMTNDKGTMKNDEKTPSEKEKHKVDTVDKPRSFWAIFHAAFPRLSSILGIAWDIRQVDIVIAHNPPMQIVGALAKIFSFFSSYHQQLVVFWWHHHIPWYYTPKANRMNNDKGTMNNVGSEKAQMTNEQGIMKNAGMVSSGKHKKIALAVLEAIFHLFSPKTWKSFLERYLILPRVKYLIATSHYTAFCLEKYCGRKSIVIHPVIMTNDKGIMTNEGAKEMNNEQGTMTNDGKVRPIILFTHGRLEPGKGLDILVKAWKELQQMKNEKGIMNNEGIKLVIAGEGSLASWLTEQGATVMPYYEGLLDEIKKTQNDTLAIYLSTIDAFGMASLEAQIAGLPAIILDKGGARETVLLDNNREPVAQLIDTENEIVPAITYFIQQRTLHKRVSNVNFCHQREYFGVSRLDADTRSLIDSVR